MALVATWAFRVPAPRAEIGGPAAAHAPDPAAVPPGAGPGAPGAVAPETFAVALWVQPPAPAAPESEAAPAPAEPALQVELLGISRDAGDARRANLYDRATDSIVIVAVGDRVGALLVERLDAGQVELADARRRWVLQLEDERP
jgi:hypothetical protein